LSLLLSTLLYLPVLNIKNTISSSIFLSNIGDYAKARAVMNDAYIPLVLRRRTDARWAEGDGGGEIFTDGPERDTDR